MSGRDEIFLSYAHAEHQAAMRHVHWLRQQGFGVWFDESIRAGESWRDELAVAIDEAVFVLFLVTEASAASEHCRKEISYALDKGTPVLTVYEADVELPGGLKLALSDLQVIHAHRLDEDAYREALFEAVSRLRAEHRDHVHRAVRTTRALEGYGTARLATSETAGGPAVVAVLPFANRSEDEEQRFFAEGIAEEILGGLSRNPDLRVIARASSWRFGGDDPDPLEIRERLGATHVVEGSVRRLGSRIRVSARLVTTAKGLQIWSENYQREVEDLFDVMDSITEEILAALELQLKPVSRAARTSPRAYEAFLAARAGFNQLDFDSGTEQAKRAIELDPSYAGSYAVLAGMELMKVYFWFSPIGESLPAIRYHNRLALSLDPENTLARTVALSMRFNVDRDYQGALDDALAFHIANPSDPEGIFCLFAMFVTLRRFDDAVRMQDLRAELDPLSAVTHRFRAEVLTIAGRYVEARQTLDHTSRLGMPDPMQYGFLAFMQGREEELAEQTAILEQALTADHPYCVISKARLGFLRERHDETRELLAPLRAYAEGGGLIYLAAHCAQLCNEKDAFLDGLEAAFAASDFSAHPHYTLHGIWAERFADVAAGDRYQSILARFGLDDASVARIEISTPLFGAAR